MSQENVDVIRRGFEHYAATGDQLWENYSDAVVERDQQSPDQAEYRGLDGVRRWIADWSAAGDDGQIDWTGYGAGSPTGAPRGTTGRSKSRRSSKQASPFSRSSITPGGDTRAAWRW